MDYLERIEQLEKQINALTGEISELKTALLAQKQVQEPFGKPEPTVSKTVKPVQEPFETLEPMVSKTVKQVQEQKPVTEAVVPQKQTVSRPQMSKVEASTQKPVKEKLSLEEKLGGKLMGMVAAVLVFIELILFGTIVYESLGDAARVSLLFLVSGVLLAGGVVLQKKKSSWFSLSLTGCGFGALYLTLFMTKAVFGLISTELLYGLLFFWFIGIGLFVWKYHSQVVAFLGLLGISMSVVFGALYLEEGYQYLFLVIYYIVMSVLYLWMILGRFLPQTERERYPKLFLAAMLFQVIQALVLASRFEKWYEMPELFGSGLLISILLSIYVTALPVVYHLRDHKVTGLPLYRSVSLLKADTPEEQHRKMNREFSWIIFGWYQVLSGCVFGLLWSALFSEAEMTAFILYFVFSCLVWLATELLGISGSEGFAPAVAMTVMTMLYGSEVEGAVTLFFFWVLAGILLSAGFFGSARKNGITEYGKLPEKLLALGVMVYTFIRSDSYEMPDYAVTVSFVCSILLLMVLFAFLFLSTKPEFSVLYQQKHPDGVKCVAYLCLLFILAVFLGWKLPEREPFRGVCRLAAIVLSLTIVNGACNYSSFCKKLGAPGQEDNRMRFFVFGINQGLWILGMMLLHADVLPRHPGYFVLLLLQTLFLCVTGLKRFCERMTDKTFLGIYLGVRVTLYVLVVLTVIRDIPGFVISCVLILIALAAIIIGFKLKLTSLRLYGLVLTMLAVLKLMMIDVRHENSLETVGCFLIAGILCFCINLVYNKVKRYVEEQ